MSLPARVVTLLVAFLAVAAGAAFIVVHFFLGSPPTVDYTAGVSADTGATVHVVMQEDPQNTVSTHPDWVSYFVQDPKTHAWIHTTLFKVPAGSKIDVTIYGYDGCTPLRNPYFGKVTGTIGGVEDVDGKPVSQLNSWSGLQRGAHVLDPRHQPERADGDAQPRPGRDECVLRHLALHNREPAPRR